MKQTLISLTALTVPLVQAVLPPTIEGMNIVWSESFQGDAGASPSEDVWYYALDVNTNNEIQTYTTDNSNIQLSGGDTVQIVPLRDSNGEWTSGRIETRDSFTPQPGKKMQLQGEIRVGDAASKQGLWPAFWALGDSMRHGTEWPMCGELDIYEQVNGNMEAHGTVHCGSFPGGACNEPVGLAETVNIPSNDFHTWAIAIDRTSGDWQSETITWMMDGNAYHVLTGAEIADEGTWGTLAHSPLYLLLNVAVGGDWPGNPTDATEDSWGSMMEISYVSVYESS
jgi:beta-glucanase (GH16 family)